MMDGVATEGFFLSGYFTFMGTSKIRAITVDDAL